MNSVTNSLQLKNLPHLLCATCQKILSQFPIYCYKGGSTCGRCPYPENGIHNEAYEILAKNIKFPCCNKENGCKITLYPRDVAQHEKICTFKKYNCPAITTPPCSWKGFVEKLLNHFETKHKMLIQNEEFFEIDFVNNHNVNYLFPYSEELYLVNRTTDSKKHMFFCTVSCIGNDNFERNASFKIILENGNKSTMHEIVEKINNTVQINKEVINSILNDPLIILAKIEIFEEEILSDEENEDEEIEDKRSPDLNYELLQELECMVCLEYMVPPIYQCIIGHSICTDCKKSVSECPTCRSEFQNTQNFALAQIIQHINYPCKFKRCDHMAKAKDIKLHEATCVHSLYKCPLRDYFDCNKEMGYKDIYDHVESQHYENLLELDTVTMPFYRQENNPLETNIDDCFIIKHDSLLFKVHFTFMDESFMFAGQFIGPSGESTKYHFEVEIYDTYGHDCRALMSKPCGPMTGNETAFDDDRYNVIFSYDQLEHFINKQFTFTIRIIEI
ncbi:uncharacterized protein LOC130445460 [Diorhabda sublineata]|uniref:uncharacterized protein LOC130445460 n=1 Tax=Diorhabda sublineata TaxID=1163346 RepID=UPI0024E116C8|nr:uncharacterized protein LOC130445460 [Diorhabda sublineata]